MYHDEINVIVTRWSDVPPMAIWLRAVFSSVAIICVCSKMYFDHQKCSILISLNQALTRVIEKALLALSCVSAGDCDEVFYKAAKLSLQVNFSLLKEPLTKVAVTVYFVILDVECRICHTCCDSVPVRQVYCIVLPYFRFMRQRYYLYRR